MIRRIHVSKGRKTIIKRQMQIPKTGITGTPGVLKARGASGCFFRMTKMPIETRMKAKSVPMLVNSPATCAGTKRVNVLTNSKNNKLLL